MAKKNKRPSNMQRREKVHQPTKALQQIIAQRPMQLAALAWAGYQEEGRGFILIVMGEADINAEYYGERGVFWKETNIARDIPEMNEAVQKYDPLAEIVVSLAQDGKNAEIARVGGFDVPPPLAYAKLSSES